VRRVTGFLLMGAGGLVAAASAALAALLILGYLEWENAADALATVALLTAPPEAIGLALWAGGRRLARRRVRPSPPVPPA
jgi:type IV secretory pathway TrbD component